MSLDEHLSDLDNQLAQAAHHGDLACVKDLVAAGADANTDDALALRMAVQAGHAQVVDYLLTAGANANASGGYTLVWAAHQGDPDVVKLLLAAGADVNAFTAIDFAMHAGNAPVIRLLREYGAWLRDDIRRDLSAHTPAVQVALLAAGDIDGLSAAAMARQGVCPEALCVLLERQGQAELATMAKSTRMLEPLTPEARADLLEELLVRHRHTPESIPAAACSSGINQK